LLEQAPLPYTGDRVQVDREALPRSKPHAMFGRRFARDLWRLTCIYWASPAGRQGALLLALAIALEFGAVYGNVLIAMTQRHVGDAVQDKQMSEFFAAMARFFGVVLAFVLVSTYRLYVRQWLEMHWRQSVTAYYLGRWIGPQAYCQQERHPDEADNPDQRIAEDIRSYVASSLGLSLSLLAAVATLCSFAGLLWNLSADWPLHLRGKPVRIPGLMLWIAVIYSFVAMGLTHLVGRPLVPINFNRLRVEADFRYGLVRFRDNAEAVALARGAAFEQGGALARFRAVIANWWQLIAAQRNLSLLTTAIGQVNGVVPCSSPRRPISPGGLRSAASSRHASPMGRYRGRSPGSCMRTRRSPSGARASSDSPGLQTWSMRRRLTCRVPTGSSMTAWPGKNCGS